MKKRFNALIIGAGQIGAFYDKPDAGQILTHAHAFCCHPGFSLLGFVDINHIRAETAALTWGGQAFSDVESVFKNYLVDVVCVAVPDEYHYQVLKEISAYPLKFVLSEKPLASRVEEGRSIVKLYRNKAIPVMVNYSRRFVPEFQTLKLDIKNNNFGRYIAGNGYYGKGLRHNGSHLIDLLRFLVDEIKETYTFAYVDDFTPADKSVNAILRFENGNYFSLQAVSCRKYSIFEVDLLFEKARVKIINSGDYIEKYWAEKSKLMGVNRQLTGPIVKKTDMDRVCYHAVDNIYNFLTKRQPIKSSMLEALRTLITCEKIVGRRKW